MRLRGRAPVPSTAPPWRARALPLLGTLVEISAPARDDAQLRRWTSAAFGRVAALHAAMSFHSADSDLAAIARAAPGAVLTVQPETWQTLALALELEAASNGLFNCAVAPSLVRRGLLPAPADLPWPRNGHAHDAITLQGGSRVRVDRRVWIDLGGIAKGVAVDAAVQALQRAGAPAGLVNAGGDLRVFGTEPRDIRLRDPRCPQRSVVVARLAEGAFATSANYFVDGLPAAGPALVGPDDAAPDAAPDAALRSVSVFAPRCALADALTKVLALDPMAAPPLLRRYAAQGLWVDVQGGLHRV